jgi:two-component system, OmpR family, response regulator
MQPHFRNSLTRPWTERHAPVHAAPLRVLTVDDYKDGAEASAAYLSFESMECRVALGGAQAIELGTAGRPDVIIMDISMPGLNGVETTLALRRDLRAGNILIIAFTAHDEADVLGRLSHPTFDGYCQKGQPPSALIALIHHFSG